MLLSQSGVHRVQNIQLSHTEIPKVHPKAILTREFFHKSLQMSKPLSKTESNEPTGENQMRDPLKLQNQVVVSAITSFLL